MARAVSLPLKSRFRQARCVARGLVLFSAFNLILSLAAKCQVPAPRSTGPLILPAEIDNSLAVAGTPTRVVAKNDRLTVPVMINGRGPYRFLIDTGADRSVIGSALARQLELPITGTARMHHIAGETRVDLVLIESLRVGTNEVRGIQAPALEEGNIGADGIMGIDSLREQLIAMDFVERTIILQDPQQTSATSGNGEEIVVTARRRRGQLILTQLRMNQVTLYGLIDTGAQVTMGNSALLRQLFKNGETPGASSVQLTSVTGKRVTAQLFLIPEMRLGSLLLRNVAIAFADVPPFELFGLSTQPAVLLGSDVLEGFRKVTLDFRRRKVRFVLRS